MGYPHHEEMSKKRENKFIIPNPHQRGEGKLRRLWQLPPSSCPVFIYRKQGGTKWAFLQKYSTNISTEAKGQWARWLPSERRVEKELTPQWLGQPLLLWLGATRTLGVGSREWGRKG